MNNELAQYLRASGIEVVEVDGHWWQNYKGVLIPAQLPHVENMGIAESARKALEISSARMVRWTTGYDTVAQSEWWFIVRDGTYSTDQLSSSTRSKLNRGMRRLTVRQLNAEELEKIGYPVCEAAVGRYNNSEFLPTFDAFLKRVRAAGQFPAAVEYWGVFDGPLLVGFSENYLQDQAVFLESIWYDPNGLRNYAGYVLIHAVLDEYLNRRGFNYVSDGSRSIYHETGVHDFLVSKFGFRKARASLHLYYSPSLRSAMAAARFLKAPVEFASVRWKLPFFRRLYALLLQDSLASKKA